MFKKIFQFICYHSGKTIFRIFLYPMYRIRSYGKKNIPQNGPLLILCNHQSFLDPIICQLPCRRPFCCVARDSLYNNKIFGFFLNNIHTIPIRPEKGDIASMRRIIEKLKDGWAVCLFPEATRTEDGKIIDVKPGFSLLCRKTGAKVMPMVVDGAFEAWPRHRKLPSLTGKIGVSYGEPILPEEIKGLTDKEFAQIITGRLRKLQTECRKKMNREPFDYSNG